jgi:flavin reductase
MSAILPPVSTAEFRDGMAWLPGAVTVVTTNGPAGLAGFTASAVCSVTDSPPTVLVCMNRSSYAHRFFADNGQLCVNVLSAHQQDLSGLFSQREVSMSERFERCDWQPLHGQLPGLDGALVNLAGRITASHDVGTHSVFIVELQQIRRPGSEATDATTPAGLVWFNRRYHALGEVTA